MKQIYTIGTSNRTAEAFGDILHHYGILNLADVRRFPASRFEHFKKENLESFCRRHGIVYFWVGDLLGAFRSGSYEQYCETDEFLTGLEKVQILARSKNTALCCAERLPWKCHRQFIARRMESRGWEVVHILDKDDIWQPKQIELF